MHSDQVSLIQARTSSPVDEQLIRHWPFSGFDLSQVIDFTVHNLDQTYLSPTNIIILDQRSNEDSTCILLSRNPLSDDAHDYIQVRADFDESSVVTLKTIDTGCGGADSQLYTNYPSFDGVLRMSVRDCEL